MGMKYDYITFIWKFDVFKDVDISYFLWENAVKQSGV